MDQKQGIPSDQPLYPAQPPPAYPGQQPAVAGQQPQGYPVQQQSGYPGQPGYPVQQQSGYPGQPGYPVQQQPGYPGQPGYPVQQQPGYPGQPQPGYGGQVVISMPLANKMNNNLILAIIATIFCCPICGIVGIVYAAQVDSAFFRGDVAQAQNYADNAKKWSIAAIVGGCLWIAIVIVYQIIAFTVIYPSY